MSVFHRARGLSRITQALGLVYGHQSFVQRNTGLTNDAHIDHYLQNPDWVLSNNRHFIADTMAEYQPNGDGTTEGQVLHIIGYCHAYLATKDKKFLDAAINAWDAYLKFFYNGQAIPDEPQRWISNWLCNSKEPTLANYPINSESPTQGGYKCVPLRFTNGKAQIPHGAPFWGEYLDVATMAHRGHMTWDAINATVQKIQENVDGKIDWDDVPNHINTGSYGANYSWEMNAASPAITSQFANLTYADGVVKVTPTTNDPRLFIATGGIDGSKNPILRMRARRVGTYNGTSIDGKIFYGTPSHGYAEAYKGTIKLAASPREWNVYEITMPGDWSTSTINNIRIDIALNTGDVWEIDYVSVGNDNVIENPASSLAWVDWKGLLGDDYTVVWSGESKEVTYGVSWINVWTHNKIGMGKGPNDQLWSGDIIESNIPDSDVGMVQLEDTSINGVYLFNYAVRLPVALGGYQFKRGEVWHNRPVNVPLFSINQMGNAADAEVWFNDACYLLWRITGEERYKKALQSCFHTSHEYTYIDATDKFFRQSTDVTTPFTDGISYSFPYPSTTDVIYSRDSDGYTVMECDQESQNFLEQQSVWFRVDKNAKLRVTYGGVGNWGKPVGCKAMLDVSTEKKETKNPTWYGIALPNSNAMTPIVHDVPITSLALMTNPNTGSDYMVADSRAVSDYGGVTWEESFESGVYDGRSATVINTTFPDDDGGFIIGFWLESGAKAKPVNIVYKTDADFNARFTDDDGWNWWWMLPNTNNEWSSLALNVADLHFAGYQPNHADTDPEPTTPAFTKIDQMNILMDSAGTNAHFSYYVVNDIPPLYNIENGWTMTFRVGLSCQQAWKGLLGDCTMIDYRLDSLAYCPGVIPFSNIYEDGTTQIGAWHGMPYPGYQYPFMYTILKDNNYDLWFENQCKFLRDSQLAYSKMTGELGPGCAAYVWNRWDNFKYGTPDTFTNYHWGDGKPWAGYQPRAYNAAARAMYECSLRGKAIPEELRLYVEDWAKWLVRFTHKYSGHTPNDFPKGNDVAVWEENDFTGHMCGLWLAGSCYALMAGVTVEGLSDVVEDCVRELADEFTVTSVPGKAINGAWSPSPRVNDDNGMSFGFYTGEINRGLCLYIMFKKHGVGYNMYEDCVISDHNQAVI